jgi:hypothetical protein
VTFLVQPSGLRYYTWRPDQSSMRHAVLSFSIIVPTHARPALTSILLAVSQAANAAGFVWEAARARIGPRTVRIYERLRKQGRRGEGG